MTLVDVLISSKESTFGGGERIMIDLYEFLQIRGFQIKISVPKEASYLESLFGAERLTTPRWKLRKNNSVLIANDFDSLRELARFKWKKKMFICHGPWELTNKKKMFLRATRTEVYFVSSYVRAFANRGFKLNSRKIHDLNYLPRGSFYESRTQESQKFARETLGIPSEGTYIGAHSRCHPSKRLELFVESVRLAGYTPILSLTGKNDSLESRRIFEKLDKLAQSKNLLLFEDIDPALFLRATDYYLSTSDRETLGVSLMEACAMRVPIVTTAKGGTQDFLFNNINCVKVFSDSAKQIAEALGKVELLSSKSSRSFPLKKGPIFESSAFGELLESLSG